MTPFLLLTFVLGLLTSAWLARPLWQREAALARAGAVLRPFTNRSTRVVIALTLSVAGVIGLGYAWLVAPTPSDAVATAPAPSITAKASILARESLSRDAGADALSQAEARVTDMMDRLAAQLRTRPDDADGWQMLGRSYAALGRHARAVTAFKTAARLRPDDATLLAEYAFSAAVTDPRAASGEAAELIARALRIDSRNSKALALAGTLAVDHKDYQSAIRYWEQLAQVEPLDSPVARQARASIAHARQLASAQGALMQVAALGSMGPGAAPAQVSGTVTLAPALKVRVAPDDTVFVFARPVSGPRMPLAVLRKQVKDLPLRFTLDDSLAMSPGARLSGASSVVVGARISRDGNAVAGDGDLQGLLGAVPVGRGDLRIEIGEIVKAR